MLPREILRTPKIGVDVEENKQDLDRDGARDLNIDAAAKRSYYTPGLR